MLDEDEAREGAFYYVMEEDELKPVYETNVKTKNSANQAMQPSGGAGG